MKTIQMTLDDDLVQAVDRVSKLLHTNRSAFARRHFMKRFPVIILSDLNLSTEKAMRGLR